MGEVNPYSLISTPSTRALRDDRKEMSRGGRVPSKGASREGCGNTKDELKVCSEQTGTMPYPGHSDRVNRVTTSLEIAAVLGMWPFGRVLASYAQSPGLALEPHKPGREVCAYAAST